MVRGFFVRRHSPWSTLRWACRKGPRERARLETRPPD